MLIRIAAVQIKAYDVSRAEEALTHALEMIDAAVEGKPHLVVLPECAYPGYFLGLAGDPQKAVAGAGAALSAFRERARRHGLYLAVGIAEPAPEGLYNSAVLINPAGDILGSARKSLLWHFDSSWFCAGGDYPVLDTPIGRIGMIVCADGRQPEISRILAINGAQLIIDVTNWVSSGSDPSRLSNPQYEYMLSTRALENRVWFVAANKVGMEVESILYCGRSCVLSPEGKEVAAASADREEVITAEADLAATARKSIQGEMDCMAGRVPEAYDVLCQPVENLPVTALLNEPLLPSCATPFASVVQLERDTTLDRYLERAAYFVTMLARQKSNLVVFPDLPCAARPGAFERLAPHLQGLAGETGVHIASVAAVEVGGKTDKAAVLFSPDGSRHVYRKVHLDESEKGLFVPGEDGLPVFATGVGRVGMMVGREGYLPEVARVLMLRGAEVILWLTDLNSTDHLMVARTRAAENRVYVLNANTSGQAAGGLSHVANPGGALPAVAFSTGEQAVYTQLELAATRIKQVVPGTNVVLDRRPGAYLPLLSQAAQ